MRRHFFITGTDTSVGKTTLSALLCAALDAVYWKPIQTGTLEGSDRVTVMRLAGIGTDRTLDEATNSFRPYRRTWRRVGQALKSIWGASTFRLH